MFLSPLEKKFEAECKAHAAKIEKAYEKAKSLSDKYGIPFASYIPKSFRMTYQNDDDDSLSRSFVMEHAPIDQAHWNTSTFSCHEFYGY